MRAAALCVVLAIATAARAQPAHIAAIDVHAGAAPPEVIVLTFGVGDRIFERFGHAAICLRYGDAEATCFNYGVTDFDATSSLVWGFLRDRQKFWVEPQRWYATLSFYEVEDRDIWAQTLRLAPEQARGIERKLLADLADDAHRYYTYDHFYDNCTTRIRDIVDTNTGGELRRGNDVSFGMTFRDIGRRGLAATPELRALSDFVVGRALDKTATVWEAMFYPPVLRDALAERFDAAPHLLYERKAPPITDSASLGARFGMLYVALMFAFPLVLVRRFQRFERSAVALAALYLGVWGLVLWSLAAISAIPGIRWNECVLVLVPFDLALPFLGAELRRRYARVRVAGLLLVSALCAIGLLRQPLWIPIITAIAPLALIATTPRPT